MPSNYAFLIREVATGFMRTVVATSERAALMSLKAKVGSEWKIKPRLITKEWRRVKMTATGFRTLK